MMGLIDKAARAPLSQILLIGLILTAARAAVFFYLERTPQHKRTGFYSFARIVNEISDALVYAAIVVFMLVRPFAIQTFYIPTGSMIDTLMPNDYIVANKFIYRFNDPEVGDIVVFHPPSHADPSGQATQDYIKRLIGGPGDLIEIKDRILYRNGKPMAEDYVRFTDRELNVLEPDLWKRVDYNDFKLISFEGEVLPIQVQPDGQIFPPYQMQSEGSSIDWTNPGTVLLMSESEPVAIPEDHYLFLGDNRNNSLDGRFWGLVHRDSIIGKSEFIWLPTARWSKTPSRAMKEMSSEKVRQHYDQYELEMPEVQEDDDASAASQEPA